MRLNRLFDTVIGRRGERGATMIVVGLALPVLLGMSVLAVDLGYTFTQRRQTQTAAEAAAVAGALVIGKRGDQGTVDHEVFWAMNEVQDEFKKNSAEQYSYWSQGFYTLNNGDPNEVVGRPCTDLLAYANADGGVQVSVQRSTVTAFGFFLKSSSNNNWNAASEQQVISITRPAGATSPPAGSQLWLTLTGGDWGSYYVQVPGGLNATAAQVQSALNTMPNIGNNVSVTGNPGGPWYVTFNNTMSNQNVIQMYGNLEYAPGWDVVVNTTTDGHGKKPETTISTMATAVLRSIAAVETNHSDFAPFALWIGSRSWRGDLNRTVDLYRSDASLYRSNWINCWQAGACNNNGWVDPNYGGVDTQFRGYLDLSSVSKVSVGDSLSIPSNVAVSAAAQSKAAASLSSGRPLVVPVVITKSDSMGGNINLSVQGFAWVKVTTNTSSRIAGRIIRFAGPGFDTNIPAGSSITSSLALPAKTVKVIPNSTAAPVY